MQQMALCNSSRDFDVLREPALIGPLVVCTKRVELHGIPYALRPISVFVDLSVEFQNLSDAVHLGSLRLLNHIADRDDCRWTSQQRSPMRRKSYKQQQLSEAIRIAIANGNFYVLKWLCTMYFREGYLGAELLELVVSLEALEVIEWLFAKLPEQTALPSGGLWQVA